MFVVMLRNGKHLTHDVVVFMFISMNM